MLAHFLFESCFAEEEPERFMIPYCDGQGEGSASTAVRAVVFFDHLRRFKERMRSNPRGESGGRVQSPELLKRSEAFLG